MTTSPTILITGSTDGLGRALAHPLAAVGAALILHGRDPGKLERTADDIRDAHHAARPRTASSSPAGYPPPRSPSTACTPRRSCPPRSC
jgi:NAD(P)-dependent dehydrogenase (short-subunit alcohol dehydrogenase family)